MDTYRQSDENEIVVGLALSGGSVLGAAHVGVLYALEESGIKPACIAGTSSGAIIGALYAFGKDISAIEEHVQNASWFTVGRLNPSRMGLLTNSRLGESIIDEVGDVNIEDAQIPYGATAVDISTGMRMLLRNGNLANAVRASACIPGVFQPVQWGDHMLVDGGVVEHLPVVSARELGANRVIGVDLRAREPNPAPRNVIDIFMNYSWIVTHNSVHLNSSERQSIITPELLSYNAVDPRGVSDLIEEGYKATKAAMPEIRRMVGD